MLVCLLSKNEMLLEIVSKMMSEVRSSVAKLPELVLVALAAALLVLVWVGWSRRDRLVPPCLGLRLDGGFAVLWAFLKYVGNKYDYPPHTPEAYGLLLLKAVSIGCPLVAYMSHDEVVPISVIEWTCVLAGVVVIVGCLYIANVRYVGDVFASGWPDIFGDPILQGLATNMCFVLWAWLHCRNLLAASRQAKAPAKPPANPSSGRSARKPRGRSPRKPRARSRSQSRSQSRARPRSQSCARPRSQQRTPSPQTRVQVCWSHIRRWLMKLFCLDDDE